MKKMLAALLLLLPDVGNSTQDFCLGDGSGYTCPCGNNNTQFEPAGCNHSGGHGGRLESQGIPQWNYSWGIWFQGLDMPPGEPCILFVGEDTVHGGMGFPFGDGLRCAGGGSVRLSWRVSSSWGSASWPNSEILPLYLPPGQTNYFQVLYKDSSPLSPCGNHFNLTNGVAVTYLP